VIILRAATVTLLASIAAAAPTGSADGSAPRLSSRLDVPIVQAPSYAGGAPPGFSGGFTEQSCHACHFHADVNRGPGRVVLDGIPARFTAGERYPLSVTVARPGLKLGGFQLTARFKDGGAQAGTVAPANGDEPRIAVQAQGDIQYANQRDQGTAPTAPDAARWSLVWTAPRSGGTVVFHVAGNAADADGTAEGDYVHTAVAESAPAGASVR
jgi:hypothetical protein